VFDQIFANLTKGFSDQFGGPFVAAEAVWPGVAVKDPGGSVVWPGTPVRYPCRAQFDTATQAMRATEGFLETDVRVLVLAATLAVPLDSMAQIRVAEGQYAGVWALLSCARDPVGIGYECRARRIG